MAVAALEHEAPNVAELSDETRQEIVTLREGGMTLAELKVRFPQLTGEQIRAVLPAGNARERKQREAKTETTKGIGGRSGKTKSNPKPKAEKPAEEPKQPKYVDDADLSVRVLTARQVLGRAKLAELLGINQSATWRAERDRVTPDEAEPLRTGLAQVEERVAAGEFVKPERTPTGAGPTKAELTHRIEVAVEFIKTARGDKSVAKSALADGVLALLDPPAEAATETQ